MSPNPQSVKPIGCLSFLVIGIIIIGIVKCFSGNSDNIADNKPTTPSYDPPSTEMAYIQSIDFVKQYLKSPSTAEFDKFSADPNISNPTSNEYIITYHFDAENSFGAKLRSNYTCSLKYLVGDPADINSWELERLIINGQQVKSENKTAEKTTSERPSKKFNVSYEIVNKEIDNTGAINLIYVYVKSTYKLDSLNKYLVTKYQDANVRGFQIYYFNNRKIAKIYYKTLFNNNVSDSEIDRLSTHIIGHYEYNTTDGGSLKLGKQAQE